MPSNVSWEVVGGSDKGGILVRVGPETSSDALAERLSTGAIIEELEINGDRLRYKLLKGDGPGSGWVAMRIKGKELVKKRETPTAGETDQKPKAEASPKKKAEASPKKNAEAPVEEESKAGLGRLSDRQRVLSGGKQVVISGLAKRPELNDKIAIIRNYSSAKRRFEVTVAVDATKAPETISLKPSNLEFTESQLKRDNQARGDEIVLVGKSDMRNEMYETKLDPQHYFDKAVDRILSAENEYQVLDLPEEWEPEPSVIKKAYRKISLSVHPDKNSHPQAGDAFRKVYGAFETLSDSYTQRKLLFKLGKLEGNFNEDEEDETFQWWWEANISEIDRAAAEAEGQEYDLMGQLFVSDGKGADVNDVGWISLDNAAKLLEEDGCIFIDCRDPGEFCSGYIPGAWNCPMEAFVSHGVVKVLGEKRASELLSAKRRVQPVIIYSSVATPFSRCRALCRWLLRAGHKSLKAERLKRLKGGMMCWKLRKNPVSAPLMDIPRLPDSMPRNSTPEERAKINMQFQEAQKARNTMLDAPWVEKPASDADCSIS